MNILALLGSPRKGGNTDILATEMLRGASKTGATTEKVYLDDYNIRPIGDVSDITSQREDPRIDDDLPFILEKFLNSDIIIWATPIYWQGVSAQMKAFNDRLSSYFHRPPFAQRFDRKGHFIICTFGRSDMIHSKWITEPMKLTAEVLRGYYLGDLCVSVYKKGKVQQMPEIIDRAYDTGKALATHYNPK
jgi:multimeric flavodoxin WrbA